jgi:hypothetical protein
MDGAVTLLFEKNAAGRRKPELKNLMQFVLLVLRGRDGGFASKLG